MVAESVVAAFMMFHRLVESGRSDLIYATVLSNYGIRQARSGRKVGGTLNAQDISSRHCQTTKRVRVGRLDHLSEEDGEWKEVLVEDKHSGPDAVASIRIDFGDWLCILPDRSRKIATLLATGESTREAARQLGVSSGRVSQFRRKLEHSWAEFQGEPEDQAATG